MEVTPFSTGGVRALVALWGIAVAAMLAGASEYPLVGISSGEIWDVNANTAELTNQRPSGAGLTVGLTSDDHGMLYTLRPNIGEHANWLQRINPVTGEITLIGDTSLSLYEGGMAYDHGAGRIYGIQHESPWGVSNLY